MTACKSTVKERHLLLLENPVKRVIELRSEVTVLGRDRSKDIVIESDLISREHATFLRIPTAEPYRHECRILDGGDNKERSMNGVFVNEQRCESRLLEHGDLLSFGTVIRGMYLKLDLSDERLEEYTLFLLQAKEISPETRDKIDIMTRQFCTPSSYLSDTDPTSIMLGG